MFFFSLPVSLMVNKVVYKSLLWPSIVMDRPLYFAAVVSCSSFFFFFLAYSQRSEIGCLPYFHIWCGLSANSECMSEMCCRLFAEECRMQKLRKKCCPRTTAQLCRAISSQLTHLSTIGKNLLNSNISSTCPRNMMNFAH